VQRFGLACKEFHCFGGFDRCDYANRGIEDASRFAGVFCSHRRAYIGGFVLAFEQTRQTRGLAGENGHRHAIASDGSGVNPGNAERESSVIQEKARFEIVGSIDNERKPREQIRGVRGREIGDDSFHADAGVDGAQATLGGDGFRQRIARVRFLKESLPLQIRRLDKIAVDDPQMSQAGAN